MVRSEVKRAGKRAEEVRATRPCVSACVCMCVRVRGKEAVNSVVSNDSLPLFSLYVFVHICACAAGPLYPAVPANPLHLVCLRQAAL